MRKILLVLPFICILSSCGAVYTPLPPSAPLLTKQGEFVATATFSAASLGSISAAYAVFDHLSVLAEGTYDPAGKPDNYIADKGSVTFNAALGSHLSLGDNWVGEVYVGAGKGGGNVRHDAPLTIGPTTTTFTEAQYTLAFAQVDIGYKKNDVDYIYQLRGSKVMFDRYRETKLRVWSGRSTVVNVQNDFPNVNVWEHAFLARINEFQTQFSFHLFASIAHYSGPTFDMIHSPINLGFGVTYRLR